MKRVQEVAGLTGVSVRTLHYYDQIGLLSPCMVTEAGYRLYGEAELKRLQHILFLRELEFPLADVKKILDDPSFDEQKALAEHVKLLELRRRRLDGLIQLADGLLKGEQNMSFKEFDMAEIEKAKEEYREEAAQRWGGTQAYAQNIKKTNAYTKEDWRKIQEAAEAIYGEFVCNMDKPPADKAVQQTVKKWRDHISQFYYDCTNEILSGLGEMYVADERFQKNIDAHAPGLAQFMSEAIKIYCT